MTSDGESKYWGWPEFYAFVIVGAMLVIAGWTHAWSERGSEDDNDLGETVHIAVGWFIVLYLICIGAVIITYTVDIIVRTLGRRETAAQLRNEVVALRREVVSLKKRPVEPKRRDVESRKRVGPVKRRTGDQRGK